MGFSKETNSVFVQKPSMMRFKYSLTVLHQADMLKKNQFELVSKAY